MIVVVTGGREFRARTLLIKTLNRLHDEDGIGFLAQGGASGADAIAKEWAEANCVPCATFHAWWRPLGNSAGHIRNGHMLTFARPHLVVAFPGGRGTANCVEQARKLGIRVLEVER